MAFFSAYTDVAQPVAETFEFFLTPSNLLRVKPETVDVALVGGPERLQLGAKTTWKLRRWGVSQTLVLEVVELEENAKLVEKQVYGPFRAWEQTRQFEAIEQGTRVTEEIEFEPPGGLLGRLVTKEKLLRELQENFTWQSSRLNFGLRLFERSAETPVKDEQTLFDACAAGRHDNYEMLLVYADWLEEHGRMEEAESARDLVDFYDYSLKQMRPRQNPPWWQGSHKSSRRVKAEDFLEKLVERGHELDKKEHRPRE